ncbi:hypothetical protein U1Q18_005268 [Sarracenia purpurea var. burkii]
MSYHSINGVIDPILNHQIQQERQASLNFKNSGKTKIGGLDAMAIVSHIDESDFEAHPPKEIPMCIETAASHSLGSTPAVPRLPQTNDIAYVSNSRQEGTNGVKSNAFDISVGREVLECENSPKLLLLHKKGKAIYIGANDIVDTSFLIKKKKKKLLGDRKGIMVKQKKGKSKVKFTSNQQVSNLSKSSIHLFL